MPSSSCSTAGTCSCSRGPPSAPARSTNSSTDRTPAMEILTPASLAARAGETIGTSNWITLHQTRIDDFAKCTGDTQWIHIDGERAARDSPFGGTVAHGFLTLSLIAPTFFELLLSKVAVRHVVNYGLEK